MSIHQINKLFQNKGCNVAMSIVLGVATIAMLGWGSRGCGAMNAQQQPQDENPGVPVVSVGDLTITQEMIRNAVDAQAQGRDMTGEERLQAQGSALQQRVQDGLAVLLAKKDGIDFPDNAVKQRIVQQLVGTAREQLMAMGALKPGATEQDLENAYKSLTGQSLLDQRKRVEQEIDAKLSKKETRGEAEAAVARLFIIDKVKSKYMPSDDAVKQSFDTYHFKALVLSTDPKTPDPKAKVEAAYKEIKAGMPFEAAMDKYMPMPTGKGAKKPSQQPATDFRKQFLDSNPLIKKLADLKPGEMSDVISMSGMAAVYKLIDHKIELPKDFATQLPQLKNQKAELDASKAVEEDIKKLDTPDNVKWKDEGYHVLSDYFAAKQSGGAVDKTAMKAIFDRAMKLSDDPLGGEAASGAAYLAFQDIESTLPAAEREKDRVDVLAAYTRSNPEIPLMIDLAEAYIKAGDGPNAVLNLRNVADANSIHTDAGGRANWVRINAAVKAAQAKHLLKDEDAKYFADAYATWQKDFADQEKANKERDEELKKAGQTAPQNGAAPGLKLSVPGGNAPAPNGKAAPNAKPEPTGKPKPAGKK